MLFLAPFFYFPQFCGDVDTAATPVIIYLGISAATR